MQTPTLRQGRGVVHCPGYILCEKFDLIEGSGGVKSEKFPL